MLRNKYVDGLTFKLEEKLPPCDECAVEKLTRLPFPKRLERSPEILAIVHSDLCGPMIQESFGGARYILTFTDDHSRWSEIYFLKSKSEVSSKFLEYKNFIENQTGKRINSLQSDNGTEYCNSKMDDILRKAGIQRRLSTAHTPQQNGVSERKNRTLLEAARCLLADSKLPTRFWAEAVAAANHVRNRCVTMILGIKTPFEVIFGRRPRVNYLRRFGSKVFIVDKSPSKDKLAPRGIEGVFVGYAKTAKAYRVWIPAEKKILVTRDVKFINENDPGFLIRESTDKNFNDFSQVSDSNKDVNKYVDFKLLSPPEVQNQPEIPNTAIDDVQRQIPDIQNKPLEIRNNAEGQFRRGPGRPSKERTGVSSRSTRRKIFC